MRPKFQALLPLAVLLLWPPAGRAQEPTPAGQPAGDQKAPPGGEPKSPTGGEHGESAGEQNAAKGEDRDNAAAAREPVLAIKAGHVHPITGPELAPGVVVIRGDRIVAVGPADTPVPAGAEVRTFADAHVYPGLVDAATDAFTDDAVRSDGSLDAGAAIADALTVRSDREDEIVRAGITTAFVSGRRGNPWNGIGTIIRPQPNGAVAMAGHEHAAVGLRFQGDDNNTHALQRQQAIDGAFAAFKGLEDYKKQFEEHDKALEKYKKDFADYLAWHEKKNGASAPASGAPAAPRDAAPAGGGDPNSGAGLRGGRGRRGGGGPGGGPGGGGPGGDERPAGDRPQNPERPARDGQGPGGDGKAGEAKGGDTKAPDTKPADDKPPERPKYPKAPTREPQKDELLAVLDGKLPLRVAVTRPDEIRAVLAASKQKAVPALVLEGVLGAAALAKELATAAVPCVLTDVWPAAMPEGLTEFDPLTLPAVLERAGVPFAIGSGSGRRARSLPLMAACAVGHGLSADAALRAITLWPAEILGVQTEVGSLQPGRLADVLVCDKPLLQSDCRLLAVWSSGALRFEDGQK